MHGTLLLSGLAGIAGVGAVFLTLPLGVRLRWHSGGSATAEAMFGGRVWLRDSLASDAARDSSGAGGAPPPLARDLRLLRQVEELGKLVRSRPIRHLRIDLSGGVGDPAATAVLYGAAWSLLSTRLAVADIRAQQLRLEPLMDGGAALRGDANAELAAPLWWWLGTLIRVLRTR